MPHAIQNKQEIDGISVRENFEIAFFREEFH